MYEIFNQYFVTLFYFLMLFRDFLRVSHYYILLYFDIVFQMFLPTMTRFITTSILELLCSVNGSVRRFCLCMANVLPYYTPKQSWALASRKLTPASVFRHPWFQSGTGIKKMPDCISLARYRTGSGTISFFIPVPDWLDAGQSGIPAFWTISRDFHKKN
jgi:hypothetical protein